MIDREKQRSNALKRICYELEREVRKLKWRSRDQEKVNIADNSKLEILDKEIQTWLVLIESTH